MIERNIYGADIDEFAINIAMLRLWLSLVIDYEGPGDPPPLPNLDFKIVRGDSLTAPDPDPGLQPDMFRTHAHKDADELARLKARFMREQGEDKRLLAEEIAEKQTQLAAMLSQAPAPEGAVDWRVEFAEVFEARDGFDVVLANPPYVRADAQFRHLSDTTDRQAALTRWRRYRRGLLASKVYQTIYEKWDLYLPFLERAYQLLRQDGQMTFIISDAYNSAKYAARSHKFFLGYSKILRLDFCSDIPLFQAGVKNTILHFIKAPPSAMHVPVRVRRWGREPESFGANAEILPSIPQVEFGAALFRQDADPTQAKTDDSVHLGKICYISYGLRAGADDRYWRGEFVTGDLVSDIKDATILSRLSRVRT